MAQYRIHGTDAVTGAKRVVTPIASSLAEAESMARQVGLIISGESVEEAATPVLSIDPTLSVPDYMGLSVVSVACGAVAWAYYALGVVLSIYILNARYPIQVRHEQFVDAALGLFGSIGVGIVFHAISYATDALRDIARNSFR